MGTLARTRIQVSPPSDRLVKGKELLDHPEWGRCELIKGRVISSSPSKGPHGAIAGTIHGYLALHVIPNDLGLVVAAETGIYIKTDPDTIRAPDVAFIRKERLPKDGLPDDFLTIAPDLAVEVVSPSDKFPDVVEKAEQFLDAGVKTVWIVEPRNKAVHIYRKGQPVLLIHAQDTLTDAEILPGFALPLNKVFSAVP